MKMLRRVIKDDDQEHDEHVHRNDDEIENTHGKNEEQNEQKKEKGY